MDREHEDLYLIILKYYPGDALANQKGNPDYYTGYTYIKLEFATALNVRTQEINLTGFTPGIYIIKCSSVKKPVRFIIN